MPGRDSRRRGPATVTHRLVGGARIELTRRAEQPPDGAAVSRAARRRGCGTASVRRVTEPAATGIPVDDAATRIAAGYAAPGPALELGAVVLEGTPYASAQVRVPLSMLNRHGLIAGATGTGKTKTLQVLAEQLSAAGVPVVLADVKGDLSGLATAGTSGDRIVTRAQQTGDDWTPTAFPVEF